MLSNHWKNRTTVALDSIADLSAEHRAVLAQGPIVFFDGVCNICNRSVNTLLNLDKKGKLRYASLQGDLSESLFGKLVGDPDSVRLTVQKHESRLTILDGFDAFLEITVLLFPWSRPFLFLFRIPPLIYPGRWVYKWVARNRYRWFGKREFCDISHLKFKDRFLN
ncbi:MAG: DUF393 domain-containing protein [Leptospiraceae bacterium]|nr:DUF393 domain-containing protein [Leptospiraceae bacterium]